MPKHFLVKALILSLAVVAAPATADAGLNQCRTSRMCVWGNNDYQWLIANQFHGKSYWFDPFNDANGENNQADSYANLSSTYSGCLADGGSGGGDRVSMPRGKKDNNLAWFNADEASSMRTANGC